MLSHGNFLSNSAAVTRSWEWKADDHLLLTLPLFHTHGLAVGLHGTLLVGSTITLHRRFDPRAVLDALASGAHTLFFGVPTMYHRLLAEARARAERPRGVRLYVSGSAPLPARTHEEFAHAFGTSILERYGMTETVMNTGNPYGGPRKPGSVGLPFPGVDVRIVDPRTLEPMPADADGEIQVRGANVFSGYWRGPDATRDAFTADGWFRTGDLAHRGADGYVFITGRATELVITGGFNVYPREVEEVLQSVPGVLEAAVVGLPDEDLGERVVAAVVRGSEDLTEDALQRAVAERLAGFKKPRRVVFVDALPKNAMGKVQKAVLRRALR
jgi:malonyl-CoA/methylmalonyl-CoA synthetase